MQVHHRWLKLTLVVIAVIAPLADPQVFTMQDGGPGPRTDVVSNLNIERTPTPTARRPPRTWIPITNAPAGQPPNAPAGQPPIAPSPQVPAAVPGLTPKPPRQQNPALVPPPTPPARIPPATRDVGLQQIPEAETTGVSFGLGTTTTNGEDSDAPLTTRKPSTIRPPSTRKPNATSTANDETLGPGENTTSSSSYQDEEIEKETEVPSTAPPEPPTAPAVMAKTEEANSGGMSTLTLGLMMGGAVATVVLVGAIVYVKTNKSDVEEDDMDPVLRTARHEDNKGAAQMSTVAANYHQNHSMSPTGHGDDHFYAQQNHNHQYDQDGFGFHHSRASVNFEDPNLDMLTPQSQIDLVHSQMSLPPMEQSNGSSQFSSSMNSFYGNSAYSANSSMASQVMNDYSGVRKGEQENDIVGSDDDSEYDGDSVQDMSQATNVWNSVGKDSMAMMESQSGKHDDKTHFMESEYSDYRMSTGYDSSTAGSSQGYDSSNAGSSQGYGNSFASSGYDQSYVDGKGDYDNSFAASDSGYDKSFAASDSGYDKSFQNSGYSDYDASSFYNANDSTSSYK